MIKTLVTRLISGTEEAVVRARVTAAYALIHILVARLNPRAEEAVVRARIAGAHALVLIFVTRLNPGAKEPIVRARIAAAHALILILIARLHAGAKEAVVGAGLLSRLAGTIGAILLTVTVHIIIAACRSSRFLINPIQAVVIDAVAHLLSPWIYRRARVVTVATTDHPPISVVVRLIGRNRTVAVIVFPVTNLLRTGIGRRVLVITLTVCAIPVTVLIRLTRIEIQRAVVIGKWYFVSITIKGENSSVAGQSGNLIAKSIKVVVVKRK